MFSHESGTLSRSRLGFALASVLMLGYLVLLLTTTHQSQQQLREAALQRAHFELEQSALTLGHFYAGLRGDLIALSRDQAIAVFHSNRALGMSMRYGLRASLLVMRDRFERFVASKHLAERPIYRRLILLDELGTPLVDVGSGRGAPLPQLDLGAKPESLSGLMSLEGHGVDRVYLYAAYDYKESHAGLLIAEIEHATVVRALASDILAFGVTASDDSLAARVVSVDRYRRMVAAGSFSPEAYTVAVPELPFVLVAEDEMPLHLGFLASNLYLFLLGALSLLILIALSLGVRARARSLALSIRGDLIEKQRKTLKHQNAQLEAEIEQRRLFERRITQTEDRLNLAMAGASVAFWDWDIQSGDTVFCSRWAAMVGYTLEELAPVSIDTWLALAHPDDLRESERQLQRHFAGETDYYECETRMRHKQGHWIWVLDRGRVSQRDAAGNPVRMNGAHIEITARKHATQRREQRLVRAAVAGHINAIAGEIGQLLGAHGTAPLSVRILARDTDPVRQARIEALLARQMVRYSGGKVAPETSCHAKVDVQAR